MLKRVTTGLAASILALFSIAEQAEASVLWQFSEQGSNLVGSFSGSLDLTGAAPDLGFGPASILAPAGTSLFSSSVSTIGFSVVGPGAPFGTYGSGALGTSTGDSLAVAAYGIGTGELFFSLNVAPSYISGAPLAGEITFANESFASLGITSGSSFVFALPSDTLTVAFGETTPVPLPAGGALLIGALGLMRVLRRRGA
ncbi:hypothetical protein [Pacificoceanicola onchidii]|uniref:hypothetical protein n=1 Tax=Pacificoceanicola onchidii TaxID=2562685 RepID=UPI0010A5FB39|nr:hypothetical protein [Pacificoceanicola onchidii]